MSEPGDRLPTLGPRGEGWVALQFLLMGATFAGALAAPAWSGAARVATSALGGLVATVGTALLLTSLWQLGPSLTALPAPRKRGQLVERGLYARARHPIYGGVILACLGWGLLFASWPSLAAAAATAAVLFLKSLREEAWLVRRYPDYAEYRRRTRRFFPLPR